MCDLKGGNYNIQTCDLKGGTCNYNIQTCDLQAGDFTKGRV